MCCRFWADESPEYRAIVEEMNRSLLVEKLDHAPVTRGEVRPADIVPAVATNRRGGRSVFPMKWGFSGRTLLVNARTETAALKPTFKDAWTAHRCAIPARHYFEWTRYTDARGRARTGEKYSIRPADGALTWLCGLYRIENGLPAFVVLTREPAESIRFIHDRMPLILPGDRVDEWIRPETRPESLLGAAVTDVAFEPVQG